MEKRDEANAGLDSGCTFFIRSGDRIPQGIFKKLNWIVRQCDCVGGQLSVGFSCDGLVK